LEAGSGLSGVKSPIRQFHFPMGKQARGKRQPTANHEVISMPIFEFRCLSCNDCFEILVLKKKEEVEARCPKCGSEEFERVLSKTCYAMAPGSGKDSGASAQTRTCSGGSCTTWEIPGHSR
jgi:putative FmdB family regulatory protein